MYLQYTRGKPIRVALYTDEAKKHAPKIKSYWSQFLTKNIQRIETLDIVIIPSADTMRLGEVLKLAAPRLQSLHLQVGDEVKTVTSIFNIAPELRKAQICSPYYYHLETFAALQDLALVITPTTHDPRRLFEALLLMKNLTTLHLLGTGNCTLRHDWELEDENLQEITIPTLKSLSISAMAAREAKFYSEHITSPDLEHLEVIPRAIDFDL
ncbi:hypothetical protein SISNIDRAFT_549477 [Sistotremastrum niveocremeum HHB9708]|nr:hypothetical protein SISNIDRAFT_549477 [Sistotremastrum niveocremeum HHB9708]